MEWTPSQKEAISYQGENILLSAAAGSGKTAVLVQRVIDKILDKENPVSINELLILTFTEAAAAEMKKKISAAINREFLADPQNNHLKKQRMLINSANISTIHAFCLQIIKANIHKTDIPVNFSIISEIENQMMKEKALDAVLAGFYEKLDRIPSFKRLVLGYGSDKGDDNLRAIISKVTEFAQSMPYPAKWLNNAAADYKFSDFASSPWHGRLFAYTKKLIVRIEEIYDEIIRTADAALPKEHPYNSFFLAEKAKVSQFATVISEENYEKAHTVLIPNIFDRLPVKKVTDPAEVLAQDNIKKLRELAKKEMSDLKGFFVSDEETVIKQLKETEPQVRTLKNIALITMRLHKRMKRQKDYLDFNDLEHELIALLADKQGNPSDVALALRQKYKEILVDEYQDTNYIQDRIFSLISRNETNIFTVGDIKQSIYKFRNAVPQIFADKYSRYQINNGGHLIALAKNFRSRDNIIDFTNYVFEKIMNSSLSGIAYNDEQKLVLGAAYNPPRTKDSYITELNITDGRDSEDSARDEAISVARRIKEMVEGKEIVIGDTPDGTPHFVQYRDIVILMRNTRSAAPIFEEVFEEYGIPLYSESGRSYLTSVEVQTVLSFLSIIDNPHQDIPLIAVMRSPMWNFTEDMLSKIRANHRKGDFYTAVHCAAENGDTSCARFLSELENLRTAAEYSSVCDLILTIYTKYNYSEIVSGMEGGRQRTENLRLLFERASEYDAGDHQGLLAFMLYIETILQSGKDLTPAKIEGENSDTVKIMSIHKSKGLEFPVVILANAFGQFNTDDIKKTVLHHDVCGLGLKYADTDKRIIYPSVPHKIISSLISEELMAEEMRLLYVALTRAKEKLIISAVIKSRTTAWASPYLAQDSILEAGILNAQSMGDWISYALAQHPDAALLQNEFKLSYPVSENEALPIKVTLSPLEEEWSLDKNAESTAESEVIINEETLKAKLSNKYSYALAKDLPVKMSVSEAKRRQSEEDFYSPHIFTVPTISAKDMDMISATDRGTITHFVLQHMDMEKTASPEEIQTEIQRMTEQNIISSVQAETVDALSLYNFFKSPVGQRLKAADEVWKEFSFYTEADAAEFYPDLKEGKEKILLQGTIDCFFREKDGNIVLLDYKTDRISESDIINRAQKYAVQLKYYKKGLESITGKKIKEAYICFLHADKAVSLDEIEK